MTDERPWQRDNWDEYEELRGWSSGHLYLEAVDEFGARVWREAQADDYTRSTWAASKRAAAERTRAEAAEARVAVLEEALEEVEQIARLKLAQARAALEVESGEDTAEVGA